MFVAGLGARRIDTGLWALQLMVYVHHDDPVREWAYDDS